MANTKQQASAARRREQQREQRIRQNQQQSRNRGSRRRGRQGARINPLAIVVGVMILLAIIIIVFVVISRNQASNTASNPTSDPKVLQQATSIKPEVYDTIGTGGVSNPLHATKNQPPLKGPNGRPEFFYAGAEYCPYCAAERWAAVTALSRFGKFGHLDLIRSSESDIPTFTFYKGTYTSQYVDFVPLESEGQAANGSQPPTLQTPTAQQNQLLQTYNAPPYVSQSAAGSIPFIDIGNQYILSGASYPPTLLQSQDWQGISSQLSDPTSDITKNIIGTANYLTAGICMTTNQQPGSVCNSSTIQTIEKTLGKTALNPGGSQMGALGEAPVAAFRRPD